MPTTIITLDSQTASDLAAAYAAQMTTARDVEIARAHAAHDWRVAEIARLDAARAAGTPEAVDYTSQPIHEKDGSEVKMDEASALTAAARAIDAPVKEGGKAEGEEKPALTPLEAAEAAHAAAHAAFGACFARCCAGHEAALAEAKAIRHSVAEGCIVVVPREEAKPSYRDSEAVPVGDWPSDPNTGA